MLVFVALLLSQRTDLGIGRFLYLAIAVLALATGPLAGVGAGLLAAALYSLAVLHGSPGATSVLLSSTNGYRCATYVLLGALVGAIAQSNRELLGRLRFLAESDPLTGLGNSRAFGNEIAERFGTGKPFALLIGDMNSLKQINDDFGHAVGDETLKQLAAVLSQSLVGRDVAYRIGGDEFAVLADQDTAVGARRFAARLEAATRDSGPERQLRLGGHPGGRRERDRALPGGGHAHVRPQARRPGSGRPARPRAGLGNRPVDG